MKIRFLINIRLFKTAQTILNTFLRNSSTRINQNKSKRNRYKQGKLDSLSISHIDPKPNEEIIKKVIKIKNRFKSIRPKVINTNNIIQNNDQEDPMSEWKSPDNPPSENFGNLEHSYARNEDSDFSHYDSDQKEMIEKPKIEIKKLRHYPF